MKIQFSALGVGRWQLMWSRIQALKSKFHAEPDPSLLCCACSFRRCALNLSERAKRLLENALNMARAGLTTVLEK